LGYLAEEINGLRQELFGPARRHGGQFKDWIDAADHYALQADQGDTVRQ
jgi:hypothetical protein